nr:MAG TPA: Limb expression 1 [Caudoviricetes sp.]
MLETLSLIYLRQSAAKLLIKRRTFNDHPVERIPVK